MNKKHRIVVRILLLLFVAYLGLSHYATDVARARLDASIKKWPPNAFVYKDVSHNLFTRQTVISDISILPPGAVNTTRIGKIVIRRMADDGPNPSFLAMDIQGMTFDPAAFGSAAAAQCATLGYAGPLTCDLSIDYTFDKKQRQLAMNTVFLSVKDVGAVRLGFTIDNTDFDINEVASGQLMLNPRVRLQGAELVYTDASLMEHVLKREAAKKGVAVASIQKIIADDIDTDVALQRELNPPLVGVLTALRQFVENPRQITLSITPAAPVSLQEIGGAGTPAAMVKLLNLQAKS